MSASLPVPRMLRNAPRLRRGALLSRGPGYRRIKDGSRLCGAASRTLHRVRDTEVTHSRRRGRSSYLSEAGLCRSTVRMMLPNTKTATGQ